MKEIAFQAGVSLATVDRALHGRSGTRETTKLRIDAAIAELDQQYASSTTHGRKMAIDVVIEAPRRFSTAIQHAFEQELTGIRPASIRARFHLSERMEATDRVALIRSILKRGSHGVMLKVPDRPEVVLAVSDLIKAGIPVVTYVTDLPKAMRHAYVGIDNFAAGQSAAWFVGQIVGTQKTDVLLALSSSRFQGEDAREAGFRSMLGQRFPNIGATTIAEGHGLNLTTLELARDALNKNRNLKAVYSIGGGNTAILQAFDETSRNCLAFAAHDLDATNRTLLHEQKLTFVMHHDFRKDARSICQIILRQHGMLPADFQISRSHLSIITPFDVPDR